MRVALFVQYIYFNFVVKQIHMYNCRYAVFMISVVSKALYYFRYGETVLLVS
jgi:hypothetical protein